MTEIREGIAAGQRVVVSGQFLVDSEASLKGALARISARRHGRAGSERIRTRDMRCRRRRRLRRRKAEGVVRSSATKC